MNLKNFDALLKQEMLSVKGGTGYGTMDTCQCTNAAGQTTGGSNENDKCICDSGALQIAKPIDPPSRCVCSTGATQSST